MINVSFVFDVDSESGTVELSFISDGVLSRLILSGPESRLFSSFIDFIVENNCDS